MNTPATSQHLITFLGMSDRRALSGARDAVGEPELGPLLRLLLAEPERFAAVCVIDDRPAGEPTAHDWLSWARQTLQARGLASNWRAEVVPLATGDVLSCRQVIAQVVGHRTDVRWAYQLSSGTAPMAVAMTAASMADADGVAALVDRYGGVSWLDTRALR